MAEEVMKPRRQEEAMAQTAINQQLTTDHGSRGLCMRIRGGPCGEQRCQDPTEWKTRESDKKKKKRSSTNERRRPCPSGCRKSCLGPPVNWFHRSPTNYHTCPSTRSCHLSRKSPQKIPFNHLQLQAHQKSAPYAPLLQNTLALAALLAHVLSTALKFIRAVIHAQAFAIPRNLCR